MTKTASSPARRLSKRPARARARAEPRKETQDRILDAAERLFAERGVDAVSVRSVLAAAGVNVSLAHYYFGGRDGLIEALVRRRFGPITEERVRRFAEIERRGGATIEDVLRAFYEYPSPGWLAEHPEFNRLFGLLQFSPNPRIRRIVHDVARDAFTPLAEALASRLDTRLSPASLIARFYFVLGVGAFAAMAWVDMEGSLRKRFPGEVLDPGAVADEIVRFCSAGLRAPAAEGKP